MSFAKNTKVSVLKTQAEIQALLLTKGATQFALDWEKQKILFNLKGKIVRFGVPKPNRKDFELTPTGRERTEISIDEFYFQAMKQRWRQLLLVIKAKIEAIEVGITTMEEEFLSYFVTHTGQTIGEKLIPQLDNGVPKNIEFLTDGEPK